MARRDDWRERLSPAEIDEIESAIRNVVASGKPMGELVADDFPLPTLGPKILRWRRELAEGRGFQLVRGAPVERWSSREVETFFWCFGLHLGTPGAQNPDGDLLGHVRDTGESPEEVRHYRTRVNINFHCDAADVVGLMCLRSAKEGGLSRIVSSVSVYIELVRRRPDLVERLYEPFMMDTKGEGGVQFLPVRPCRYDGRRLRTFYHTDYFRSAKGFAGESKLSHQDRMLLDLYNEIADSPELFLDMDFAPGDIQLISNHTILHARTAYDDFAEPERKRHLLRLWISLDDAKHLRERWLVERSRAGIIASTAVLKLTHALRRAMKR